MNFNMLWFNEYDKNFTLNTILYNPNGNNENIACLYLDRCETFSVMIPKIGVYPVYLRAENNVSMVESSFTHYIENPILSKSSHTNNMASAFEIV